MKLFSFQKANIFIYALLLVNIAAVIGYLVISRTSTLFTNKGIQEKNIALNRNLQTKIGLAIKFVKNYNSDGGTFKNAIICPTGATLSGTTQWQNLTFTGYVQNNQLVCRADTTSGTPVIMTYSSDFSRYSTGYYVTESAIPSIGPVDVSFGDGDASHLLFATIPTTPSNIDGDLNSDDYTCGSSGSTVYPFLLNADNSPSITRYEDNDCLPRKELYGVLRSGAGWENIFWNSPEYRTAVGQNTNNSGGLLPSNVGTGVMAIMIDEPVYLRFVEYNTGAYSDQGALRTTRDLRGTAGVSGAGYLGYSGSSLFLASDINDPNLLQFDPAQSNFGIFLSFSGTSTASGMITNAQYRLKMVNMSESSVYISPINDSLSQEYSYYSNEIIVSDTGEFLPKASQLARAIIDAIPLEYIPDIIPDCFFDVAAFECTISS